MRIYKVLYDSSKYEIVGSEKHKQNIPSIENTISFTKDQLKAFEKQVDKLNETGQGSRACFYISK